MNEKLANIYRDSQRELWQENQDLLQAIKDFVYLIQNDMYTYHDMLNSQEYCRLVELARLPED